MSPVLDEYNLTSLFDDDNVTSFYSDDNITSYFGDDNFTWSSPPSYYDDDHHNYNDHPNPIIAVFVGVVVFGALVCVICASQRREEAAPEQAPVVAAASHVLEADEEQQRADDLNNRIKKLPQGNVLVVTEYGDAFKDDDSEHLVACFDSSIHSCGNNHCPICLGDYLHGETIVRSRNKACTHVFHQACLISWVLHNEECPLCRQNYLASLRDGDIEAGCNSR